VKQAKALAEVLLQQFSFKQQGGRDSRKFQWLTFNHIMSMESC
jgi:hypothetical protein